MRLPLKAENLEQLHALIDEAVEEIRVNLEDDVRFDEHATRTAVFEIDFVPAKGDPSDLEIILKKKLKLPPRLGKRTFAVVRDGRMLLDRTPEETPLFAGDNKVRRITDTGGSE